LQEAVHNNIREMPLSGPVGLNNPNNCTDVAKIETQNIATFHKQPAARLGLQNMLQKPTALPTLSGQEISPNSGLICRKAIVWEYPAAG